MVNTMTLTIMTAKAFWKHGLKQKPGDNLVQVRVLADVISCNDKYFAMLPLW